jgi:hypothetical protein
MWRIAVWYMNTNELEERAVPTLPLKKEAAFAFGILVPIFQATDYVNHSPTPMTEVQDSSEVLVRTPQTTQCLTLLS